jgi:hypothetical protein
MHRVYAILWRHLWPLGLHYIFRHYLINGVISGKRLLKVKCVFWFSLQLLSKTFLILRRIQRDIVKNVEKSSCKVPLILVGFQWNLNFLDRFSKKAHISSLIKIRPVGDKLFHTDRMKDITQVIVAFPNFANALKNIFSSYGVWTMAWTEQPHSWILRVKEYTVQTLPRQSNCWL